MIFDPSTLYFTTATAKFKAIRLAVHHYKSYHSKHGYDPEFLYEWISNYLTYMAEADVISHYKFKQDQGYFGDIEVRSNASIVSLMQYFNHLQERLARALDVVEFPFDELIDIVEERLGNEKVQSETKHISSSKKVA